MSVNQKEKKICISYLPNKKADSKDVQYLLIDEGAYLHPRRPNENFQILDDIFSDAFPFRISSIFARVQHYESSDFFVLVFIGRFDDSIVIFEKDDKSFAGSIERPTSGADDRFGLVLDDDVVANAIIRQRWQSEFHDMSTAGFLRPTAWIDRNDEIKTMPIDYQKKDDVNGLVMAVKPPVNGIKYIKLKLNLRYFPYLTTSSWMLGAPVVLNKYYKEPYYLLYGAYRSWTVLEGIPTRGVSWVKDYDCKTGGWTQLPVQKAGTFELYSNVSNVSRAYKYSLPVRIVGAPFSAALDIVTFPFQFGIVLYMKETGMH